MTGNSSEKTLRGDAFDELADLFLTEANGPAKAQAVQEPAFRELLIVGNLPVRGGVWLTPYADAIARENGPTALVRFDIEPPTLELLRMDRAHSHGDGLPSKRDSHQPVTLKDAVLRAASEIAVWIVRGPAKAQPADLLAYEFDRITILTSSNSAAVVAAYQIIKEIAASVADDAAAELPPIALAIAGADEQDAVAVVRRMNDTATAQLGISVELACCLTRMDAGIRCETFASFAESDSPTVRDLLEWIDTAAEVEAWEQVGEAPASLLDEVEEFEDDRPPLRLAPAIDDSDDNDDESEREALLSVNDSAADEDEMEEPMPMPEIETIRPEPVARPHASARANHNGVRLAPKPSSAIGEKSTSECRMPSAERRSPIPAHDMSTPLAPFVAGLSPLPVRCPAHEEIELAADDAGRVHVLAREGSLRELRVVENWARAHRQLIALACGDLAIDAEADVVCHIFTDEPATLADLHNTGLMLHVLAPVQVGNETAWYAAPLSR